VCYAGSDDKLHCAGRLYGTPGAPTFTSQSLSGVEQILLSSFSSYGQDSACVLTRGGIPLCLGWNDQGELGNGTTSPVPAFATWGEQHDIAALANGYWGPICALDRHGVARCAGYG